MCEDNLALHKKLSLALERDVGLYLPFEGACDDDERRWVLLQIPRCDIDGVGEGK